MGPAKDSSSFILRVPREKRKSHMNSSWTMVSINGTVFSFPSSSDYSMTGKINEKTLKKGTVFPLLSTLSCRTQAKDTMWITLKRCEHSACSSSSSTLEVLSLHNTVPEDTPIPLFSHSKTDFQLFFKLLLIKDMFIVLPWQCRLATLQWPNQDGHWASISSKPWFGKLEFQKLKFYL